MLRTAAGQKCYPDIHERSNRTAEMKKVGGYWKLSILQASSALLIGIYAVYGGVYNIDISEEKFSHMTEALFIVILAHGLWNIDAVSFSNVTQRKFGISDLFDAKEDLVVIELIEI